MNAMRALPGPREIPWIGSAAPFLRDPLEFLERTAREHGDVARFRLPGQTIYLFSHPSAIEEMLVSHKENVRKDKLTRELSLLLGNGLLISEGTFWRKQRMLAQPGFHRERIAAYGDVMVRYAERAIAGWRDGEVRDVHKDMMRLTLDVVAKTLFGVEIVEGLRSPSAVGRERGETSRRLEAAQEVLIDRFSGIGAIIPIGLPTPANLRARKAIRELDDIVYGIIRERRAGGDNGDLLSMLIAATSDEGGMTDVQLRDEAITLLLAGHETTALTLGYALHLLAEHPDTADRLAQEAEEVLGERPATAADLPKLKFADAVVRESLRLYPPAWAVGRETAAPLSIAGWSVPAGTQVWGAQWVVHRDARWFEDPHAFRPERWENDFAKSIPRYAYFPFGGGHRICIGNAFAMMEAVLILVTIARRFRTKRASDRPLELVTSVTLRPKHGLPMTCTAR